MTMAEDGTVKVTVVTNTSPILIKCSKGLKAEDLCVRLCKEHKIPPLTRSLFALRVRGKQYFLKDNCEVLSSTRDYELRIRFKVLRLGVLITLDKKTYDFYFKQVQQDVYENRIPEIKYPEHKKQLFGLGIADMSRAIFEEKLPMKDVINNYKKYIPKVIVKKHGPFLKKYAQDYLPKVCSMGHDITYLKNLYLQHVYTLAPNYLAEEYDNVMWQNGEDLVPVKIVIVPFHPHEPGIRLYNTIKRDWFHVCAIEEVIYLTRNGNDSLEVSRKGTPLFLKFPSEEYLASFISLCDGYYRLMVKWTFNLSKDDETPSLKELQRIKCHGPVGGAFSYRKLEEKRGKKHGSYILRKCQYDYDVYFLDVCTKSNTTETHKIVYKGHGYILNGVEYPSIERIIAEHSDPEGNIFLNECIPPSEYDKSQLLLCGEPERKGIRIDQAELQEILRDNKSPRCLPNKDILLYTEQVIGDSQMTIYSKKISSRKPFLNKPDFLFNYISIAGDISMWDTFYDDEVCKEHTTFNPTPNFYWKLREKHKLYSLTVYVRSFHSAIVFFTLDPYNDYPRITVLVSLLPNQALRILYQETKRSERILSEALWFAIDYWAWTKIQFRIFKNVFRTITEEDEKEKEIIRFEHDIVESLKWFSIGSNHTISHWSVYCKPMELPTAYPPDCYMDTFLNERVYEGKQWVTALGSEKIGSENITATYKALWRLGETKKLVVAYKTLQKDKANEYLKDFIELASKWSCIQSSSIVRLYGVTLSSPTALVLEYLPYGPFDQYLRENSNKIQEIDLKKVAAALARALWDLSEAGVVHGYIRCRRLLLSLHDADRIVVKLSGPALCRYKPDDVHWMPVDFFADMEMARRSVVGDIWAFATTLWEVFSYGQSPTHTNPVMTARSYKMGERLLKPAYCPNEVWEIMRQCWQSDPLRPQEIMRDMNHMLHKEYVPRNVYEEPYVTEPDTGPRYYSAEASAADTGSNKSLISSDQSSVISINGTTTEYDNNDSFNGSSNSLENMNPLGLLRDHVTRSSNGLDSRSLPYRDEFTTNAPVLMQSIVCGNRTHLVTLDKKIGGGTYGEVYKGWMESDNQEFEKRVVAVKNLNQQASEGLSLYTESKNELDIMKSLYHENIVKILGYWWKGPELMIVMEYMEQGSLYFYLMYQGDMLTLTHLISYAKDIASGMEYISCKNIVHRDLAARNILVVDEHRVKISDFGLARIIPREENEYRVKTDRLLPIKWYAPESAVEPFHFSTKSDVWSYGVTAWEIFTRARQEIAKFDVFNPTQRAACFPKPEDCPSEIFRHLMKNCWELQPERRPSFIELVRTCERFLDEYK